MKPTRDLLNSTIDSTAPSGSATSTQPFNALMALYKARVYETYADRFFPTEDADLFAQAAGNSLTAPDKDD